MTDLERCARAAYAKFKNRPNRDRNGTETWEQLTPDVREMWMDFIAGAFEEAKTPSEGMIDAGRQGDGLTYLPKVVERQWTAMIQHILEGK
jgi:hypothetical protein